MNQLSEIDCKILKLLQNDGRMGNTAISRELGLTHTMVARRLEAMEKSGLISGSKAKEIFERHLTSDIDLAAEIEANKQTSDTGAIEAAVDAVLAANADKVAEYKGGKEALFGFFVGQTMKAMQGKGNPQLVNQVLKAKLG